MGTKLSEVFRKTRTMVVASDEPNANWDKYAADLCCSVLDKTGIQRPIFLPTAWREWASFWESIGSAPLNLMILGSPRRFEFTHHILQQLMDEGLLPEPFQFRTSLNGSRQISLGTIQVESRPLSNEANAPTARAYYVDYGAIVVAKDLQIKDSTQSARRFRRLVLVMGLTGPATLGATKAFFFNTKHFEPQNGKALTSILDMHVGVALLNHPLDNRYVIRNSIRLLNALTAGGKKSQPLQKPPQKGLLKIPEARLVHQYQPKNFLDIDQAKRSIRPGGHWHAIWGWKRDSDDGSESRTVYLRAHIVHSDARLWCVDPFFHYKVRSNREFVNSFLETLNEVVRTQRSSKCYPFWIENDEETGVFEIGKASRRDRDLLKKLSQRRREPDKTVEHIRESEMHSLSDFLPCDLYVGSGLSYEAGVPQLAGLHSSFGVDSGVNGDFLFGKDDPLPKSFVDDFDGTFRRLLSVETAYINAEPTASHRIIKLLQDRGDILNVFTDNVDDLLHRAGVRVTRTRLHGLYNERFDVTTNGSHPALSQKAKSLLVVGVSADRREVILQARQQGKKIIVVNPLYPVSPHSKNVDYLRPGDIFLKKEFREITELLPKVVQPAPSTSLPPTSVSSLRTKITPAEAVSFLDRIGTIPLKRTQVVGNYHRFDEKVRNNLFDWYQMIVRMFARTENSQAHENFLIGAQPGSGKTFFVDEIKTVLANRVAYYEFGMPALTASHLQKLGELIKGNERVLCLIDEVDKLKDDGKQYQDLLEPLEANLKRSEPIVFVLAGSASNTVEGLVAQISKRDSGPDLITRIPYHFTIPTMTDEDKLTIFAAHVNDKATKHGRKIGEIEKLALYFVLMSSEMSTARQVADSAKEAVVRLGISETRLKYDDLFDRNNIARRQFLRDHAAAEAALSNRFTIIEPL